MKFNKADNEIFETLTQEFIDKYGEEIIKDIYKLHRKLSRELQIKNFPISEIYHRILLRELKYGKYSTSTPREISKNEEVHLRTIKYFLP